MKGLIFASISIFLVLSGVGLGESRQSSSDKIGCFNEKGEVVDWYMGYKFPKIKNDKRFETGYSYAYFTSEDVDNASEKRFEEPDDPEENERSLYLNQFKDLLVRYAGTSTTESSSEGRSSRRKKNQKAKPTSRWNLSSLQITDPNSALLRTVKPAYDEGINALIYNDDAGEVTIEERIEDDSEQSDELKSNEPAISVRVRRKAEVSSSKAHAKGFLMMDEKSNKLVWVTHSIPKFPPRFSEPLAMPESAQFFGQTFMCMTFNLAKSGKMIVDHLRTMKPQVYDSRLSDQILELIPNLKDLETRQRRIEIEGKKKRLSVRPKLAQIITTMGGQMLNLFSKSKQFNKDIYDGWIDEDLGSALYVETWRRGGGNPLNSSCPADEFHTNNVKDLKYDNEATWSYMSDHSKWAISEEEAHGYVCIGDSNRMASQFKRGGGAVCMKCPQCWTTFSNTILDVEPCPIGSRKATRKTSSSDPGVMRRIAKLLHL